MYYTEEDMNVIYKQAYSEGVKLGIKIITESLGKSLPEMLNKVEYECTRNVDIINEKHKDIGDLS